MMNPDIVIDKAVYEAAKALLETELAESTDEREVTRLTSALDDITKRYNENLNASE